MLVIHRFKYFFAAFIIAQGDVGELLDRQIYWHFVPGVQLTIRQHNDGRIPIISSHGIDLFLMKYSSLSTMCHYENKTRLIGTWEKVNGVLKISPSYISFYGCMRAYANAWNRRWDVFLVILWVANQDCSSNDKSVYSVNSWSNVRQVVYAMWHHQATMCQTNRHGNWRRDTCY